MAAAWSATLAGGIVLGGNAAAATIEPPTAFSLAPAALSSASSQSFSPPYGGVTEFGAAVAAFTGMGDDIVVIGAPGSDGGGRVFYFTKPQGATSFGPGIELRQPNGVAGDRFGASVAVKWGVIVVGAPHHTEYTAGGNPHTGAMFVFEQPRDSNGLPIAGSAFLATPQVLFSELSGSTGVGTSVSYDPTNNIIVSCGIICLFASKSGNTWYAGGSSYNADRVFQQGYSTGWSILAAGDHYRNAVDFYDFVPATAQNAPYYGRTQTVFPATGTFKGIGGQVDRVLVGVAVPAPGHGYVAQYTKNLFSGAPYSQWTNDATFTVPATAGPNFGAAIAMSGDYALVGDPRSDASSTVHQFHVDRGANPSDNRDDTWTEIGTLGTFGDASYGTAVAVSSDLAITGWPAGNEAFTFDVANPLTQVTRSDPSGRVSVTMTVIGSNPGETNISIDPTCAIFSPGFDYNTEPPTCVEIANTSEFLGLVTICFDNPGPVPALFVVRCRQQSSCPRGEGSQRTDATTGQKLCCKMLTSGSPVAANPLCVQSDGFSSYAVGQTIDTDGDFSPDLTDNCPTVFNFSQEDGDQDLVGTACDNCPSVANQDQRDTDHDGIGDACDPTPGIVAAAPVPAGGPRALLALGVLLIAAGGLALQRRWRGRAGQ